MPMDIVWAIQNNEIYILQARAITTLKNDDEKHVQKYIKECIGIMSGDNEVVSAGIKILRMQCFSLPLLLF